MPPIAQELFCPLYRIDLLITEYSLTRKVHRKQIISDLTKLLGISKGHFRKILNCQIGESGFLNTLQLTHIAAYFECPIDDLINKQDLQVSSTVPGTSVSPMASGDISSSNE